jgi:hypothetical protein
MSDAQGNGKLSDDELLKLSASEVNDAVKYTGEDRRRWEELQAKERLERYIQDPHSFVEVRDMVACVIHSDQSNMGIAMLIPKGVSRAKLNNAVEELRRGADRIIAQMDVEAQSKIVAAQNLSDKLKPHHMRDGVRKMFRGG